MIGFDNTPEQEQKGSKKEMKNIYISDAEFKMQNNVEDP